MSYIVDLNNVSTQGLESSPVVDALAGLRANEARYFMNKYKHSFTVLPVIESQVALGYAQHILKTERGIEFAAKPLETSQFQVENIQFTYASLCKLRYLLYTLLNKLDLVAEIVPVPVPISMEWIGV